MAKEKTAEEILEAAKLLERIMGIDLGQLEVERFESLRPMDQLVEDLQRDKRLKHRGPKGSTLKRTKRKQHWRTTLRKRREYYHAKTRPREILAKAEQLKTPEGWYTHVTRKWVRMGLEVFTLEEWVGEVWPTLEGRVPYVTRYDTGKGFTLDNVLVREDQSGIVLFDGKEYLLRKSGYIL